MMNIIADLVYKDLTNAFGWALIHSVWQSMIILLIVFACLRFIPAVLSGIRYAVACSGLFLFIATSVFTFIHLMGQSTGTSPLQVQVTNPEIEFAFYQEAETISPATQAFSLISSAVQSNMPLILLVWAAGFLLFFARLSTGVLYTCKLRSEALPLENVWSEYIKIAKQKLGINRLITLGESAAISTPMVIGYFKPVILIPVGMLTGLTTEQLETIFLHELAHIKRHDYLINFVQSVIETVFFFNPFIWSLSNIIRREREFCCDDLVIRHHGGAGAYAHALVQLAEVRLSAHLFALSLADDKNQLLNRIRRIMENSVKNYSGKNRMIIPAILLLAGLFSISWLGIQQEKGFKEGPSRSDQDTVVRKNEKGAHYSGRSIITLDEEGQPHEEIPVPSVEPVLMVIPVPPVDPVLPDVELEAIPDTIPFGLHFKDRKQWEKFSKDFEEKFKTRFEDSYSKHQAGLSEIMKEMQEKFQSQDWLAMEHFRFPDEAILKAQEDALRNLEDFETHHTFKDLHKNLETLQENLEHMQNLDLGRWDHDGYLQKYDDALRKQLISDGYLSENEPVERMEWNDDSFKVNGTEIKDSDRKKYRDLHDKYFEGGQRRGKVE
ncbi:MAG: M56 family metallopeptidase [Cyclobacteriaceae bacterium]